MKPEKLEKSEYLINSEFVYEGRAVSVRVDRVRKRNGLETTREIVRHRDCIVALPLDKDNNVLLVRQYRRAVDKVLLELPAGSIDPGEKPEEAVVRELQEEIGYLPEVIKRLGGFYVAPGYCTEYIHIFLAKDLTPGRLVAEDSDEIIVESYSLSEAFELVSTGEICDAKSIIALSILRDYR